MRTELCDRFGIDYPIFVFTPSEKVAAAVSKAGGLGVLGCVRFNEADDLEDVLHWIPPSTSTSLFRSNIGSSSTKPLPTLGFHRCRKMRIETKVFWAGFIRSPGQMSRWR
ncbi:MAG TPA: hypothetical protein VF874_14020 [Mycobacterium sp.]